MNPEFQKLAVDGIRLIERHAKQHHGITFKVGMEQEFFLFPEEKTDDPIISNDEIAQSILPKLQQASAKISHIKPTGDRFYIEEYRHTYEYSNRPLSPIIAANDILSFRQLCKKQNEKEPRGRLSFNAFEDEYQKATAGLHVNVSALQEGNNIHQKRYEREYAQLGIMKILHENMLLLMEPNPKNIKRLSMPDYKTINSVSTIKQRHLRYIENKMPSANSDPYMATLLTLAGAYMGFLKQHAIIENMRPVKSYGEGLHDYAYETPNTFAKATNIYTHGTELVDFLNQLSAETSDRDISKNFGTHFKQKAQEIIAQDPHWNNLSSWENSYLAINRESRRR